ncbi:MAG: hypothetical protein KF744_03215 [Taibaiella sp.]|nr:hypothetical protein [Taibaiella sp.]
MMINMGRKHIGLLKTFGFLGLFIAMFFSYRFMSVAANDGDVVEISVDGYETVSEANHSLFSTQSDNKTHFHSKFRHAVRKRGLSRTNYLKRTVHDLSSADQRTQQPVVRAFLGYAWLYHRPSYYVHLFRYALF